MNEHLSNKKSPKYYVSKYISTHISEFAGKHVVDFPAGSGVISSVLLSHKAKVHSFDLFPEYFTCDGVQCIRADINEGIPMQSNSVDFTICQEGIEHFSDQLKALKEFNRVLKLGGKLLITTPSHSNLASKFSYLLFESETNKQMPPNEIDDVWMSDKSVSNEIYYGHIFLIGLQKLRVLAKLAGFKIKEIKYVRLSKTSLFLLPIFYPIIYLSSYFRYRNNLKKNVDIDYDYKKSVYKEQFAINTSVKNLLNHHTFMVLEKSKDVCELDFSVNIDKREFFEES